MSLSKPSDGRQAVMGDLSERRSLFVGKLKPVVKKPDLENLFGRYGRIVDVRLQLTHCNLDPFAYVTYEKEGDAQDAVWNLDGHQIQGGSIRVEKYQQRAKGTISGPLSPPQRTPYRVSISGLPKSATWIDLKDHFRGTGPVGFANTFGDGTGIVEFLSSRTMDRALKALDGSTFRSFQGDKSQISLLEIGKGRLRKSRARSIDRARDHRHGHEDFSRSRSRHGRGRRSRSPPPSSGSRSKNRRRREEENMEVQAKVSKRSSNSTCDLEREHHRRRNDRERSRPNSALRWSRSK